MSYTEGKKSEVRSSTKNQKTREKHQSVYLLLLDDPARLPGPLLDTTEIAFAIASTAESLSANVFLSERSASEKNKKIIRKEHNVRNATNRNTFPAIYFIKI